ncbi:MAG: hypothetical protein HY327_13570 [Chloroflexi bacterium]|nr:hypothetical protein [Chloroflexota bacterium]
MVSKPMNPLLQTLDSLIEGRASAWLINLIVIPLMIVFALVLPPLSLPQRILSLGFTSVSPAAGGGVSISDGAQFSIPSGTVRNNVGIRLSSKPRDQFLKDALAKTLPAKLDVKSALYQPSLQGELPAQAILSMPIPEGSEPLNTLTVFGYDGKKWSKLPFQIFTSDQRIETYITLSIPQGVIVAQTQAQPPTITADVTDKNALPAQATPLVAEISPIGFYVADGASVAGNLPTIPANDNAQVLPNLSNLINDQRRADIVEDVVGYPDSRKAHIQAIVDLTVDQAYPGVTLDYQGMGSDYRGDFATFVRELGDALHAKNKILGVILALPVQRSSEVWDTGSFDWASISHSADIVRIPLPTDRAAYAGTPSAVSVYLQWAVGQIDQYKLHLDFSVLGRDEFENSYAPVSFANALKLMGPIQIPSTVAPDSKTTLDLPRLRESGGIKFDASTGLYTFTYKDNKNVLHTVVIENAESISKKLNLALQYNLRGVALRDLNADTIDPRVWDALKLYRDLQSPNLKGNLAIVWRVNNQSIGKTTVSDPKQQWTAPKTTGDAKIEALLSFDAGQTGTGTASSVTIQVARSSVAATNPSSASGQPPAPRPTAVPAAPKAPASNFAGQNLFNYGAQMNWTNADPNAEMGLLTGMGFKWAKIQVRWCDVSGSRGQADLSQIGRFLDAANGRGVKVLLSVVCAPKWSRADGGAGGSGPPDNMQDAADFMSGMGSFFCNNNGLGAIEVWNEHNLLSEWHGKGISAALYMDMLRRSYTDIKAKCPRLVVVSGAPTPTGVMSETAIDDVVFLEQMYQNGLKQYSDAIGAHPSGFCNAPDAGVGTPNGCNNSFNNHRSFFVKGTLEAYRAVMVKYGDSNKQIWPTEFGWGVDPAPKPGYEYEKFITLDQQAQWLVRAFEIMKGMGYVGVSILWNLDFTDMSHEVGAFHVVGRPAYNALAGMPK